MKQKQNKKGFFQSFWGNKHIRYSSLTLMCLVLTVGMYFLQEVGDWLQGSVLGVPVCPVDSGQIVIFPVDGVVNSFTEEDFERAISTGRITSMNGMPYSASTQEKLDYLEATLQSDLMTYGGVLDNYYKKGGHNGIDMPEKIQGRANIEVKSPFQKAKVYKVFDYDQSKGPWGHAVTLCFKNSQGVHFSQFAHLKERPMVNEGDIVEAGDLLGILGGSGQSWGNHLHWQITRLAYYNPYYAYTKEDLVKYSVDPVALALKPNLVLGDINLVASSGISDVDINSPKVAVFKVNPKKTKAKSGESVVVEIIAEDSSGSLVAGYQEKVEVVASSETSSLSSEREFKDGKLTLTLSDSNSGEVILGVKEGNIIGEAKVVFEVVSDEDVDIEDEDVDIEIEGEIKILDRDEYQVYEDDSGSLFTVFNDQEFETASYPLGLKVIVPEGTDAVSIFTSEIQGSYIPQSEFVLSKFDSEKKDPESNQPVFDYYPRYEQKVLYKKVVAKRNDQEVASLEFKLQPGSLLPFVDIVPGVTDERIYQAVVSLKNKKITKGNPDGSYGVDQPLNRAAAATFLIRAFYPEIDLSTLEVADLPFADVSSNDWFASALYFANLDHYDGYQKPVIIKGYQGNASPSAEVNVAEYSAMVLRVLGVEASETDPWYQGYLNKMVELNFLAADEATDPGASLTRGIVARLMYEADKYFQAHPVAKVVYTASIEEEEVADDNDELEEDSEEDNAKVDGDKIFYAESNGGMVHLHWEILNTTEIERVEIWKSTGGENYNLLKGYKKIVGDYEDEAGGETSQYRLKIVYKNGNTEDLES